MKTLLLVALLNPFIYLSSYQQPEDVGDLLGVWIRVNARDGEISRAIITEDANGIRLQLFVMQISAVDNSLYEEYRGAVYLERKMSQSRSFYFSGKFEDIEVAIRPQLIKGMLNLKTSQNSVARGKRNVLQDERRPEVVTENYLLNRAGNVAREGMINRETAATTVNLLNDTPYSMDIYKLEPTGQRIFTRSLLPRETAVLKGTRQDEWIIYSRYALRDVGTVRPTNTLQQINISSMISQGSSIPNSIVDNTRPFDNSFSPPSSLPSSQLPARSSFPETPSSFDNMSEPLSPGTTQFDRSTNSNGSSFAESNPPPSTSQQEIKLRVYNNTRKLVDLYTYDQAGQIKKIQEMKPGTSSSHSSIEGQIWLIRDSRTNEELTRYVTNKKERQPVFAQN